MHDIADFPGGQALALGPDMLLVVCLAAVPGAGNGLSLIDGGYIGGIVLHAIGIGVEIFAVQAGGAAVSCISGMVGGHHALQGGVQVAAGSGGLRRAAGEGGQCIIAVAACVIVLGFGGQEQAVLTPGAPVGDVTVDGVVLHVCCGCIAGSFRDHIR